jgi:hypothetical protein
MATKIDTDLFKRIREAGVKKSRAKKVAKSVQNKTPKQAQKAIADLQGAVAQIQDRIQRGPEKRQAAAKKAAATRRRNALKRSTAAKKAARTRAKATA